MTDFPIEHQQQKVISMGIEKKVTELLVHNLTYREVADRINGILNNPDETIDRDDISNWFLDQTEEFQMHIKKRQFQRLSLAVYNMERRGVKVREDAMDKVEELVKKQMDKIDDLSSKDISELSKVIMKTVYIQESAERFSGVGKDKRNYGDVNVNVTVDVTDRMKELTKDRDKIVDAEYKDVSDSKKKGKKKE